tara:strand:- start:37 stop:393 length:357 start_codon:yes stop_codon:yes gene_type:complete
MSYINQKSFEERKKETTEILTKYPDRIPCILEKSNINSNQLPTIDKSKFLIPGDLRMSQFMFVIRKRINIKPDQAIFIFCNGQILLNHLELSDIYAKYKSEDNYLYLQYSGESTFGTF